MGRLGVVVFSRTSLGGQQDPAQRGVGEKGSKKKREGKWGTAVVSPEVTFYIEIWIQNQVHDSGPIVTFGTGRFTWESQAIILVLNPHPPIPFHRVAEPSLEATLVSVCFVFTEFSISAPQILPVTPPLLHGTLHVGSHLGLSFSHIKFLSRSSLRRLILPISTLLAIHRICVTSIFVCFSYDFSLDNFSLEEK